MNKEERKEALKQQRLYELMEKFVSDQARERFHRPAYYKIYEQQSKLYKKE